MPSLLTQLGGKQFYLFGNGVMIAELSAALSDLGVAHQFIYEEAYFDAHHDPDASVVASVRERFAADDLFSPFAHREASLFQLSGSLGRNADPSAPSDLFRGPDSLSHRRRPPP